MERQILAPSHTLCYYSTMAHIDWTECALIETVPGKRGGKPVIKGTRLTPEDLLTNREQGVDWLVENHGGITPETVRAVFDFHDRHKARVPHPA
jgi:uncharacterized protein (DUF433 family)